MGPKPGLPLGGCHGHSPESERPLERMKASPPAGGPGWASWVPLSPLRGLSFLPCVMGTLHWGQGDPSGCRPRPGAAPSTSPEPSQVRPTPLTGGRSRTELAPSQRARVAVLLRSTPGDNKPQMISLHNLTSGLKFLFPFLGRTDVTYHGKAARGCALGWEGPCTPSVLRWPLGLAARNGGSGYSDTGCPGSLLSFCVSSLGPTVLSPQAHL